MASGTDESVGFVQTLSRNSTLNLLLNLTMREVKGQYRKTVLGRLWSLMNPLANIAIYSLVFGVLIRAVPPAGSNSGIHSFALWVACGVIAWGFMASGTSMGQTALSGNAGLLTKVYFPRFVLPTASVLSLTSTFFTELAALALVMGLAGGPTILFRLPLLVPIVILNAAFVLGIALVLSVAVVYFGDIQHLWGIFLQLWLYASGIVIPISMVVEAQQQFGVPLTLLFEANPGYQFVEAYRDVLYDFAAPDGARWLAMVIWATISLAIGAFVFRRFSGRIVEEL